MKLITLVLSALALLNSHGFAQTTCEALALMTNTAESTLVVQQAVLIAANETTGFPEYCSVTALVDERFGFWAMFPLGEAWNNRSLMLGCGGSCGENLLTYAGYADYAAQGYAIATTSMHVLDGESSLLWGWGHNNMTNKIDFAYLSTHLSALLLKDMTTLFYGTPAVYRYFYGGSTGGRQGLVESQRYPDDFHGIVGIAPAGNETGLGMYHILWAATATLDALAQPIMDYNDTIVLNNAATEKCDDLDGLRDGIIGNMNACQFDPRDYICKAGVTTNCVSEASALSALKVYQGARNSKGVQLFPSGPNPGSELNWQSNYIPAPGSNTSVYYNFGKNFAVNMAYEVDPNPAAWWPEYFDWDTPFSEFAYMESFYSGMRLDMTAFRNLGGKYILYQGQSDQSVVPLHTRQMYERIRDIHGGQQATDEWFRYFEVPGVNHVSGGVGADTIQALAYLDAWVTNNTAPDPLIGQHVLANGTVAFERPHFKFPYYAHYKGGDPTMWQSFSPELMPDQSPGLDMGSM